MIIVAVVLDEGRWGRNVARLHRGHAGSSGVRRGLAVEVRHPEETQGRVNETEHQSQEQNPWNNLQSSVKRSPFGGRGGDGGQ